MAANHVSLLLMISPKPGNRFEQLQAQFTGLVPSSLRIHTCSLRFGATDACPVEPSSFNSELGFARTGP